MTPIGIKVIIPNLITLLLESCTDSTGPSKWVVKTPATAEVHTAEERLNLCSCHWYKTAARLGGVTLVVLLHLLHCIANPGGVLVC
jgi:hypothetical protein